MVDGRWYYNADFIICFLKSEYLVDDVVAVRDGGVDAAAEAAEAAEAAAEVSVRLSARNVL